MRSPDKALAASLPCDKTSRKQRRLPFDAVEHRIAPAHECEPVTRKRSGVLTAIPAIVFEHA